LPEAYEGSLLRPDRTRQRQLQELPTSLGDALYALEQDDVITDALGQFIFSRYAALKKQEIEDYNRQVTAWELDYYLSRF